MKAIYPCWVLLLYGPFPLWSLGEAPFHSGKVLEHSPKNFVKLRVSCTRKKTREIKIFNFTEFFIYFLLKNIPKKFFSSKIDLVFGFTSFPRQCKQLTGSVGNGAAHWNAIAPRPTGKAIVLIHKL